MKNANKEVSASEDYFCSFRKDIVGFDHQFTTPYGQVPLVYADWIASGRLFGPIEDKIRNEIGPMVGNTHSESSETGVQMTHAYEQAHNIIKRHVNANEQDVLITTGSGMTGVLAKFQRILGLKIPERIEKWTDIPEEERPLVFLTHMEHHSNQTPWLESLAEVVILEPDENLLVNPESLRGQLEKFKHRKYKYGSFSACSNVTGISTPYYELAQIMHEYNGYCFVDFAASAPYITMNMHPEDPMKRLDAIFFSPHKFLGGPGSSGVLVFNQELYKNRIPDHPGGGTVTWTNPWGEHQYFDDIEIREDGGTPAFLQTIKTAFAIKLKEKMNVKKIHEREKELVEHCFDQLNSIKGLHILAENVKERLPVFSFYVEGIHHNLLVKLLNDRFGIQVRGGCSCAGTYGHYLLNVPPERSHYITDRIDHGDWSEKPGWIRLSLHPVMTTSEVEYILNGIETCVKMYSSWKKDYKLNKSTNEFRCKLDSQPLPDFFKL